MSITPYINASIIIQLLTIAIPSLEAMAKEGEEGLARIKAAEAEAAQAENAQPTEAVAEVAETETENN